MFSLATRPVTAATAARQSPQPRGAKMGAMTEPMEASMDSLSSTISRRKLKVCRNQMRAQARKMTVPAFLMNARARSHMCRSRPLMVGRW